MGQKKRLWPWGPREKEAEVASNPRTSGHAQRFLKLPSYSSHKPLNPSDPGEGELRAIWEGGETGISSLVSQKHINGAQRFVCREEGRDERIRRDPQVEKKSPCL